MVPALEVGVAYIYVSQEDYMPGDIVVLSKGGLELAHRVVAVDILDPDNKKYETN